MIARFPQFSKLDISHKVEVEAITSRFEPYSDFNFISLFSWNTDGSTEIAEINGNLVIKLPHYLKGTPVYSFMGDNDLDESLKEILVNVEELELVPETVIERLNEPGSFLVEEDHDNHDYIYSVNEHADLPGERFSGKRKKAGRFVKRHEDRFIVETVDLRTAEAAKKVQKIFNLWASAGDKTDDEATQEKAAIDRLLENAKHFDTIALVISVDEGPAGFSIHELVGENYAICHFHKAVPHYGNMDLYLTSEAAKDLRKRNRMHINWEQDLGLEGLRKSKTSYHPTHMLKKYTVRLAS